MKTGQVLSLLGTVIMAISIIYGFVMGDFTEEGSILLSMIWGKITMIDIYIGFLIFSAWIIYRENHIGRSLIWFIFMMVLGSFTACLYLYLNFRNSRGNWKKFWYGHRLKSFDLNWKNIILKGYLIWR